MRSQENGQILAVLTSEGNNPDLQRPGTVKKNAEGIDIYADLSMESDEYEFQLKKKFKDKDDSLDQIMEGPRQGKKKKKESRVSGAEKDEEEEAFLFGL